MKLRVPRPTITAQLAAETASAADRTVSATFYSGAVVPRFSWDRGSHLLSFDMTPGAADLSRLNAGAPVLDSHQYMSTQSVVGVVESARLANGEGVAKLRFATGDADAEKLWNKMEQKILRNVSMGVELLELKETTSKKDEIKTFLATKWRPFEISVVPVGADGDAQIHMAESHHQEIEVMEMETTTPTTQRTTESEKLKIAKACRLDIAFLEKHVDSSLEQFRAAAIDEAALKDQQFGEIRGHHAEVTRDRLEGMRERMTAALYHRIQPNHELPESAREYADMSMIRLGEELLRAQGKRVPNTSGRVLDELLAFQSVSDFPIILQDAFAKTLLNAYEEAASGVIRVSARTTATDFKTQHKIRIGEMPKLEVIPDSGEFKRGARTEIQQTYALKTAGKVWAITRTAIINDDMNAFQDSARPFGQAAQRYQAQTLVDLLAANSGLGPTMADTTALFTTGHGNLAGTPATIPNGISAARLLMRRQTGVDGVTRVNIQPKFLLVPAALETAAETQVTLLTPNSISDVNVFSGALTVVVDPRLDDISATKWWLFADPSLVPVLQYAFLAGQEGPEITSRVGFDVDGVEVRVRLDFGAGAVDTKGAVCNAGA